MSKQEQMAYKMEPAGHEKPEEKRKYKQEKGLAHAFVEYLNKFDDDLSAARNFSTASQMIRKLKPTVSEMHGLLIGFKDYENCKNWDHAAGTFASAVYNKVPDKEIVFDLELDEVDFVGYKLKKGKTIINKGALGWFFGCDSEGMVINRGEATSELGAGARAPVINYGSAGESMGYYAKAQIINHGDAETIGYFDEDAGHYKETPGLILNYGNVCQLGGLASGLVINLGDVGERTGENSTKSSMLINYGIAGEKFGCGSEGIIIAVKNPKTFERCRSAKTIIKEDEIKYLPKLKKYLDNFKAELETGRNNHEKALKVLENFGNAKKIQKDIETILRKEGYRV